MIDTKFKSAPTAVCAVLIMLVALSGQSAFAQRFRQDDAAERAGRRATIRLPDMPPAVEELTASVSGPEQIDGVTKRLGIAPRLLNFNLATPVDLSAMGLGRVVHIPVQISNREGGRKSLYFLDPGEEVLAGIFVTNDGLALRYVKRLNGRGTPARTGDLYETRVTTTQGEQVYREEGRLEVLDPKHGRGRLVTTGRPARSYWVWWLWSCILEGGSAR